MAGGSLSLLERADDEEEDEDAAFLTVVVVPLVAAAADGTPPSSPAFTAPLLLLLLSWTAAIIFLNTLGTELSRPISSLCASAAARPRWRTRGASRDRHWAEASRT